MIMIDIYTSLIGACLLFTLCSAFALAVAF